MPVHTEDITDVLTVAAFTEKAVGDVGTMSWLSVDAPQVIMNFNEYYNRTWNT